MTGSNPWPPSKPAGGRLPMMHPVADAQEDWQFYPEAIQSWRAWKIVDFDGVILLQSITYRVNWLPRQEMIAECRNLRSIKKASHPGTTWTSKVNERPDHGVPDMNHGCGIYSLKSPEDAMLWASHPAPVHTVVWGKVSIWGNCFKFEKGYLSEFAYPSLIYVPMEQPNPCDDKDLDISPEDLAIELSETYRVEAILYEHTSSSTADSQTYQGRRDCDH